MPEIKVTRTQKATFQVEVRDGNSQTVHNVTASDADMNRYGSCSSEERLIEKSFEFLLEREPKEAILRSFDLSVIERYFPEYPQEIRKRLE